MSRRRSIFAIAPENQDNLRQQDEFSNEIDQNLRTLALVHPFSDTTKSLLKKVIKLTSMMVVRILPSANKKRIARITEWSFSGCLSKSK